MDRRDLIKLLDDKSLIAQLDQVDQHISKRVAAQFQSVMSRQFAEGKRLRPILTLCCAKLKSERLSPRVLSAAAAIEMVHQASLLHDFLIDEQLDAAGRARHLLAGDAYLAAALSEALAADPRIADQLSQAIATMAEGEMLQLKPGFSRDPASNLYIETAAKKTGALFAAACWAGGYLAGLNASQLDQLVVYGEQFGIAFQIADDLSDGDFVDANRVAAAAAAKSHAGAAAAAAKAFGQKGAALEKLVLGYLSQPDLISEN
jgi:geranylgeranyl pyrophosphate synthase